MEFWDIYNANREKTGRTIMRGEEKVGDYHIVVHVCIINDENKMLIQQRQSFKFGFPNRWDVSMGGSALAGEDSKTAANRELLEEIGFNYDFSNSRPNFTINFRYGFDDYYIIRQNIDLDTLVLQEEEVKDVNWATKEEIINMIDDETFIPYHKELIRLIFEIHEHDGAIVE